MATESTTPQPAEAADGPSRRAVIRGAAIAGAVVVGGAGLSACGGDSGKGSGSGDHADQDSKDGKAKGDKAPLGKEIAATADIEVGGGKVVDKKVVVTQPKKDHFKAFSAICTHQGCVVKKVADGKIHCPCHGSVFSATNGSVKEGPATEPLKRVKIKVKDGKIHEA